MIQKAISSKKLRGNSIYLSQDWGTMKPTMPIASGGLHPGQVDAANEVFSPSQDDYNHAEEILDAYAYFTSAEGGALGAVMLGDEMIDEASRKMATVIAAKGRAAGMARTTTFQPPAD